jgi:hypothetical protein
MLTRAVYDIDLQVQDGDMIDIDVGKKAMTLEIPEQVPTADRPISGQRVQRVQNAPRSRGVL